MKRKLLPLCTAVGVLFGVATTLANFDGAIWTTVFNGAEVDFNIYPSKDAVYLNGGPGKGSGSNANGLPDGTYVFMVTNPSGDVLLSTDPAECRQVTVVNGEFNNVLASGACAHATGSAPVGVPVQLIPYDDTPNNG